MDASAPQWLIAIEHSGLGAAIRQSVWVYPAANVAHVVSVTLFLSCVVFMDVALLRVIRGMESVNVVWQARTAAILFFCVVAVSGSALFIAEASHIARNPVFLAKMGLVALGLANALFFGRRVLRSAEDGRIGLRPGRVWGVVTVSFVVWIVVVALGRFIAYV